MVSSLVFVFIAFFLSFISAAPLDVSLVARDVFVPPVLTPNSDSVWKIGTNQTVTWDVSNPPKRITNSRASIVLVKDGRLDIDHPLATDLDVLCGSAVVLVPETVAPGDNYQIIVFGDSGNTGEPFSIIA